MKHGKKIVVFDFDGVIVDSLHAAYTTWQEGGATITLEDYRKRFEGNINHAPRPADIDFFTAYAAKTETLALFPGMAEVIATLAINHTLAISSSSLTNFIEKILDRHTIAQHFADILGNDIATSKEEKFHLLFERYKTNASRTVMITDTLGDLREAAAVKVSGIAVTWGFHSRETLAKGNPAAFADSPAELSNLVTRLLAEKTAL